jgi:hypothetical protein
MKQPFTIGGSVPLKKALLEETGIAPCSDSTVTYKYMTVGDPVTKIIGGSYEKLPTYYQLPQDWDKAVQAVKDFFVEEPKGEAKTGDVKAEHVRAFVKEWMEGHETDTFITNEHGIYVYSAGPTSINLVAFFEELVQDYIDHDPQPQAKEAKPQTLVLKGVKMVVPHERQGDLQWVTTQVVDLHLTATHLQQIKEYFNSQDV